MSTISRITPIVQARPSGRANALSDPEDFRLSGAWSQAGTNGVTVTANDAIAPDGTLTADRVAPGGAINDRIQQSVTVPNDALPRVGSAFVRKGGSPEFRMSFAYTGGTGTSGRFEIDTNDGSVLETTSAVEAHDIESFNRDWWYVWLVVLNNGAGNTNLFLQLWPDNADGDDAVHLWGASIEGATRGAIFPTTYEGIRRID